MQRKPQRKTMSDNFAATRKVSQPARTSLIKNGVKYKAGQDPVRVCPERPVPVPTLATPL